MILCASVGDGEDSGIAGEVEDSRTRQVRPPIPHTVRCEARLSALIIMPGGHSGDLGGLANEGPACQLGALTNWSLEEISMRRVGTKPLIPRQPATGAARMRSIYQETRSVAAALRLPCLAQGPMRFVLTFLAALIVSAGAAEAPPRILVYTRNGLTLDGGKGYIHENIAVSVATIRQLGSVHGFSVDVTDDPETFTDVRLKPYRAIVFSNTNNQVLTRAAQQTALQRYMRSGGGFVAIHSAVGSMRAWPWFWSLIGGSFVRHPKLQEFTIRVVDRTHPSTAFMDASFRWTDEFYFLRDMPPDLHVLLAGDLSTLEDAQKPLERERPLAWCHEFEGGRAWTTTLGHRKEHYVDPLFQQHLLGGIRWSMRLEP
jgi:uncharacterized protein